MLESYCIDFDYVAVHLHKGINPNYRYFNHIFSFGIITHPKITLSCLLSSSLHSLIIQTTVDKVYVGIKSPTNGMNSSVFMAVDTLLLVILKRRLV